MRRWLSAIGAAALLTSGSAFAADLGRGPPPVPLAPVPVFTWTGFYIGVNGGGASGHTDWQYFNVPAGTPSGVAGHNTSGGLVGGTVGFNYQFTPNLVAGLEGDWDWANITGGTPCPSAVFSCQSKISSLGTFRGRLGWAWDRLLIYGTGGLAWGDVNIRTVQTAGVAQPPSGTPINGTTSMRTGWAAGAGLEYAIWQSLTLKAEWIHYDLGSSVYNVDAITVQNVHAREHGNLFRVGLNWKFGWSAPPAPVVAARY